jgi:hypothetical protein
MAIKVNYPRLVAQGRIKAAGIPWSKEEQAALNAGMTPDEVREGYLSKADIKKLPEAERQLSRMNKTQLLEKAKALGIEIDGEEATVADIRDTVKKAEERAAKAAEKAGKKVENDKKGEEDNPS